jgi:hypothetical protein
MDRLRATRGLLLLGGLTLGTGCAETVEKAAKTAGPVAVESSVKGANEPATRDRIAQVLSDPEIRSAMARFTQSAADGVLNSVTEKERSARAEAASDAFVEHMSQTLARSLDRDFAPAVSKLVAESLRQSLDADAEARIEQVARAAARGSAEGLADGVQSAAAQSGPALDGFVQKVARTAGREAALGFQDAVAASVAKEKAGSAPSGDVLAAAGRAGDSLLTAFRLAGWLLVIAVVFIAVAGIAWSIRHLARASSSAR